jgi:hypothetical protein
VTSIDLQGPLAADWLAVHERLNGQRRQLLGHHDEMRTPIGGTQLGRQLT